MRNTKIVFVAAVLALAVCAGAALGSPATTTTTVEQTNETTVEQSNETASVSFADQKTDGDSVTIDAATLPDGGFAVVYDEGGASIGHTDYLEAGDHGNLTVSLNESVENPQVLVVTLYRNNGTDTYNASEDAVAYETDSGADVSDVSYVYFEELSRDATATETSTTAAETTDETRGEETTEAAMAGETTADETTEGASGGIPGFTPVTVVVALFAAALVAVRQH